MTSFHFEFPDQTMMPKNHYVFMEAEKFLLYGFILLGAVRRKYKINNITNERIFFPMCYLHSYDCNGNIRNFLPLAYLLTRCNQPRLDILYIDMDNEEVKQKKEGKNAPFTIVRYSESKSKGAWLRFDNEFIDYFISYIANSCNFLGVAGAILGEGN